MCVSQFRDYCQASRFNHSNYDDDLQDKNLEVRKGTSFHNGRSYYYVTDLIQMKELVERGNHYAKKHSEIVNPNDQ